MQADVEIQAEHAGLAEHDAVLTERDLRNVRQSAPDAAFADVVAVHADEVAATRAAERDAVWSFIWSVLGALAKGSRPATTHGLVLGLSAGLSWAPQ